MWKTRTVVIAVTAVAVAGLAPAAAFAATPNNVLVSGLSGTGPLGGGPANGAADRPQISGDGRYVTFDSMATNLDPRDTLNDRDVYRRDLQTGQTELVSVGSSSTTCPTTDHVCNTYSWPSDDGNLVAFTSDKAITTLTAPGRRVYVRDMTAGLSEMVSVNSKGQTANAAASRPMMSSTGRFVVFSSKATNLSPLGGNGTDLVYLRDRQLGTTTLVSTTPTGGLPSGSTADGDATESYRGMVSDDGRYVTYSSAANNIVPGDTNNSEDVFTKDMVTGITERISVRSDGSQATGGGFRPYMSPDGRFVLFNTYDPIVPDDTNGMSDVYMVDRSVTPHAITWVSVGKTGTTNTGDSLRGFVSNDGRYAVFNSYANNLADKDFNGGRGDAFVRDLVAGKTYVLSLSSTGGGADGNTFRPVPSADGGVVTFLSLARNLVPGDTSSGYQVYAVSTASVMTPPDTTAPTIAVQAPAPGATVTNPVTLSGTVSDNQGIRGVDVGIRRGTSSTGYEWLQSDGSWTATVYRGAANVDTTAGTWSEQLWASLPDGSYNAQVRAIDTSGNVASVWVGFKVATPSTDTTAPTVTLSSPTSKSVVTSPVTFTGTASDDVAVKKVAFSVKNTADGTYLQGDGSWATSPAYQISADLASPSAPSTTWSKQLALPAATYATQVTAWDTSNNQPATKPWITFTVSGP